MRSNKTIVSIPGINGAKRIAKLIVGSNAFCQSRSQFTVAPWSGMPCWGDALRAVLGHTPTATCVTTHVTGGASDASMRARSGRRQSRRPAAS